jgi:hypothetical protein
LPGAEGPTRKYAIIAESGAPTLPPVEAVETEVADPHIAMASSPVLDRFDEPALLEEPPKAAPALPESSDEVTIIMPSALRAQDPVIEVSIALEPVSSLAEAPAAAEAPDGNEPLVPAPARLAPPRRRRALGWILALALCIASALAALAARPRRQSDPAPALAAAGVAVRAPPVDRTAPLPANLPPAPSPMNATAPPLAATAQPSAGRSPARLPLPKPSSAPVNGNIRAKPLPAPHPSAHGPSAPAAPAGSPPAADEFGI